MGRRRYALAGVALLAAFLAMDAPARPTRAAATATFEPSCRAILAAGGSTGDGVYTVEPSGGSPYSVYCDMTTDGGGWTAVFAGQNGSPNVFDHFDAGSYTGTFTDPAAHYLRRAPVLASAAELAVSCGGAMVKFAVTEAARAWMTSGTQAGWIRLSPLVLAGTVPNQPNSLWTGNVSAASFIFARNQGTGGNTFASSYSANMTFDYCNGTPDQSSLVRVFYREAAPAPVVNTPGTARESCRAILAAGESGGNGTYWLQQPPSPAYQAYCDMTTDGGGWTAVFAGRNGTPNVFDRFETGYVGTTSDPGTRYLRRAPVLASAAEFAVSCGGAMVKFALTEAGRGWMTNGTQAGWVGLSPTVLAGTVPNVPNWLWSGSGGDLSFIFTRDQGAGGNTFASTHPANQSFDYCNGVFDQASLVRVYYREVAPAPVHNTPGTAGASCKAILTAGGSGGDGTYWLQQPPSPAYQAYCDMTTDGGGWTAVFAGRNGSTNVFDHFDSGSYAGTVLDPASRYLRRAPSVVGTELAVSCDKAMVKFPLTLAARNWLVNGTQADWIPLTPTVVTGTVVNVPNTVFTGNVSAASFIFARNQGAGGNTFASSYSANMTFDYCNGVFDQASLVRVFYREQSPTAATVALPGRVLTRRGTAVAGVKLRVTALPSGRASRSETRTDRRGRFTLRLEPLTVYVVRPSKPGYRFKPASREVSVPGRTNLTFTVR